MRLDMTYIDEFGIPSITITATEVVAVPETMSFPVWRNDEWVSDEQFYEIISRMRHNSRKVNSELRELKLNSAVVTISSGKTFDADETSQNRMLRAIIVMGFADVTETKWVLSDNTHVIVHIDELKEALLLAGMNQIENWGLSNQ